MAAVTPLPTRWRQRWEQAREWLSLGPLFIPTGERLFERYSEPGRHYHDARHILSCLEALDHFPGRIENHNAIEFAIWFHDAIYDPQAKDNEEKSAELFRSEFQPFATGVEKVERLILATRHLGTPPQARDEALIIDIDLGILGADPVRYRAYAEDIRKEYQHLGDEDYLRGRSAVLRSFLSRKNIYQTRHFRKLLEQQARKNIVAELDLLDPAGAQA